MKRTILSVATALLVSSFAAQAAPASKEDPIIITKQLQFILAELNDLHAKNAEVQYSLKNSEDFLKVGNYEAAAEGLHKILNDPQLSAQNPNLHEEIIIRARKFGEKLVNDKMTPPDQPAPHNKFTSTAYGK